MESVETHRTLIDANSLDASRRCEIIYLLLITMYRKSLGSCKITSDIHFALFISIFCIRNSNSNLLLKQIDDMVHKPNIIATSIKNR